MLTDFVHLLGEALSYDFFLRALAAVIIASPLLALLGCLVLETRTAYFADAVGHGSLAGVALGALLGLGLTPSLLLCAVAMALAVAFLRHRSTTPPDAAVGVLQSGATALGVVLLSRQGGFTRLSALLLGDVLGISDRELAGLGLLAAAIVPLCLLLFNRTMLASLGPSLARSRGISPARIQSLFGILLAVAVASCLPWIGVLVIQALVILPAAAARNCARSLGGTVRLAVLFGFASGVCGLFSSYFLETATGATIVLVAFLIYAVSALYRPRC